MRETVESVRLLRLAEKARVLAESMLDDGNKRAMLDIAAAYERLAKHAAMLADATKRLVGESE
jgi:hypothetical protein